MPELDVKNASVSATTHGTFVTVAGQNINDLTATTDYVNQHPEAVQKFVNALVWTLKWIHSHSAAQIAAKMPASFAGTDMGLYVSGWQQSLSFYSPDGIMPPDGPSTQYKILAAFEPDLASKHVNLKATYTNRFALRADKTTPPKAR